MNVVIITKLCEYQIATIIPRSQIDVNLVAIINIYNVAPIKSIDKCKLKFVQFAKNQIRSQMLSSIMVNRNI